MFPKQSVPVPPHRTCEPRANSSGASPGAQASPGPVWCSDSPMLNCGTLKKTILKKIGQVLGKAQGKATVISAAEQREERQY